MSQAYGLRLFALDSNLHEGSLHFSLNPVLTKTRFVINWNLLFGWLYAFRGGELANMLFSMSVFYACFQLWLL